MLKKNKVLSKNKEYLHLLDDSIKEQVKLGVVEKIGNFEYFAQEHPEYSVLPTWEFLS